MNDLTLDEYVAHARLQFEEELIRHSYRETDDGWEGAVAHKSGPSLVRVTLPAEFPFSPPMVTPVDLDWAAWSWHRELDGALCLVAEDDHDDLWWADARRFLAHTTRWFAQADLGWPDDRTDLDLERYFPASADQRLVIYGELQPLKDNYVRLRMKANIVLELSGRGVRPAGGRAAGRDRWGYVADLGELAQPPRSWEDLRELIGSEARSRVERGTVDTLIVTYVRGDHPGAAVFDLLHTVDGIVVRRLQSGPDTLASRRARAGKAAEILAGKHVAILGVGAIGSFLADALARAGVGHITLVDRDVIKPGNLVRHLVGPDSIGLPKSVAVRNELNRRFRIGPNQIMAEQANACDPALTSRLLEETDLVINATADFGVTALLQVAATDAGTHALSICVQNSGHTARLDVLPPISGTPIANSARPGTSPEYFEAGCGSPVSPTPPQSVLEAAAISARHAVGFLVGDPLHPAGEVRELDRDES